VKFTFSHYRKSVGALVVYDVTNRDSFLHVKRWLDELKDHAEPDIQIVLVGNKVDLVEANPDVRKVTIEEAKEFSNKNKLMFYESSAEQDKNVKTIFSELLTKIYDVKSSTFTQQNYEEKKKRLVFDNGESNKAQQEESKCCS
jgi:Rab family protein